MPSLTPSPLSAGRFLRIPAAPPDPAAIRVDEGTTARRLTVGAVLAARRWTIPASILMIGHQVGEAAIPVLVGVAIDTAIAPGDPGRLMLMIAAIGVTFLLFSFSYRIGSRIGMLGVEAVQHRLRMMVSDRVLSPRGMAGRVWLPGESLSIATADVGRVSMTVAVSIFPVGELAGILFCAIVLLNIWWPLGLAVLLGAPLVILLVDLTGRTVRKRSGAEQEMAGQAAGSAADFVSGFRVLKGFGAGEEASRRYQGVSRAALAATLRARYAEGRYLGTLLIITGAFTAGVATWGAWLGLAGHISIGELIAAVGATQALIPPLQALALNLGGVWASGVASAERVLAVLHAPPAVPGAGSLRPRETPGVQVRGLDAGALTGLDLELEPAETVCVLAGAQEAQDLADVLGRRRLPEAGEVLLDGEPLERLAPGVLLAPPHEAHLFEGTIGENVEFGGQASHVDLALEAAACGDIVDSAPGGLGARVGEGGHMLSGGQRQRIALARALAHDAPVLVLHEPTTAVDSVTEASIAARLRRARSGRTTLILTGSPALLAQADRIVVVRDGRAVYSGTHEELLAGRHSGDYLERIA